MSLTTQSVPNFEEAAAVASEFITSLDNLPQEVQHLLHEIKLKEQRCQELLQDISKDQSKYIKAALKQSSAPSTPTANSTSKSRTASPITSMPTNSHSKAHLPARITSAYAEIDVLTNEKVEIAQRIMNLLTRTRARLDSDLAKVRTLQGEPAVDIRSSYVTATNQLRSASPYGVKRQDVSIGLSPVIQIGDNLRNAVNAAQPDNVISISSASGPSYTKKRRLNTNTSIKLPSPAPVTIPQHSSSTSRSRHSRQAQAARVQQQEEEDPDADAEGEEDLEGDADEEDLTLYCFCHKQSYGDFHITCVGVKTPLPDKWYCPECLKNKGMGTEKRKGRKK
ncbi:hypothetical protein JR316_0004407 [Psilocybe cubensis]|uniref:Uncharacterized protein n=2 Tax=Psilocybe cubensis TaxID=181762 RepID=A0ACB8H3M2_PSICU|nr:hypothetical protein JR316_0004407 [Psilocybe cubensis]KAH9482309.1 hypothetical protein JR316_0004407 [Psilocybe cubensis]